MHKFLFYQTVLSTFSLILLQIKLTVRDKVALWMTPEIKRMILEKAKIYRRYIRNGRNPVDSQSLCEISYICKLAIKDAKASYFTRLGNSLNDLNIGSKKYWRSVLNQFLHKGESTIMTETS